MKTDLQRRVLEFLGNWEPTPLYRDNSGDWDWREPGVYLREARTAQLYRDALRAFPHDTPSEVSDALCGLDTDLCDWDTVEVFKTLYGGL